MSEAKDSKGRTWSDLCQPSLLPFRKAAGAQEHFLCPQGISTSPGEEKALGRPQSSLPVPKWALRELERDFPQGYGVMEQGGVALN